MGQRVEICAPMGVGKTTLVKGLAERGFTPVYERFDSPYLEALYKDPSPTLANQNVEWFVNAQNAQLQAHHSAPADDISVFDYSPTTTRAYIDAGGITGEDNAILQKKIDGMIAEHGYPDLLIVLTLPREERIREQTARIHDRNRDIESSVPQEYLQELNTAIDKRLAELPPNVRVLEIDARRDFRNPEVVDEIAEQIRAELAKSHDAPNRISPEMIAASRNPSTQRTFP